MIDAIASPGPLTVVEPAGGEPPEPLEELGDRICSGAVRLAAATSAWLGLVAEFDERGGWHGVGINSCAHWLAWKCSLTPGTARQHVRVARALRGLPLIATAFASGELSYSKVRALTRVAEPGTEKELVGFARHATASQVERTVRAWRRSDDVDSGHQADRRRFSWWIEDDGMVTVQVRMEPEPGAQFLASIESMAERDARRDRAARRRAAAAGAPPDPEPAEDEVVPLAVTTARRCRAMTQLAAAAALEGGPALTPAQARRLACDAAVTTIVTAGAQVLAQGRARRYATRAQRRALLMRDGGCARPGCQETRIERLHAHHLRSWLSGGRTDVSNMVLLCDVDHGLVHDHDLVLSRPGGRLVAVAPDGRRLWTETGRFRGTADDTLADLLPTPDALPAALPSDGGRMDLQHAVWALMAHREVVRRRAA